MRAEAGQATNASPGLPHPDGALREDSVAVTNDDLIAPRRRNLVVLPVPTPTGRVDTCASLARATRRLRWWNWTTSSDSDPRLV